MGIRLDWESDTTSSGGKPSSYVAKEDPERRRARMKARLRFLAVLAVCLFVAGVLIAMIAWRLNEANAYIESLLRDTVEAEFAALRIGDWNAFADIQRSATSDWLAQQRSLYDAVQAQKRDGTIDLTGTVRELDIDGTRGRVLVEWVRDGVPLTQAWFYWRYDDIPETRDSAGNITAAAIPGGWRHVPADLTFWGDPSEMIGANVTIAHRTVDTALAEAMGVRVESWIGSTCGPILQCGDLPHITLDIRPDFYLTTGWDSAQPWRLLIPSPYIHGARSDMPFSGDTLNDVADAIALRLTSVSLNTSAQFDLTSDAGYIVTGVRRWLLGRYVGVDAQSTVIAGLAAQRGATAIGELLKTVTPDSTLNTILAAYGVDNPTDSIIDWSDFLRGRIRLESDYAMQGNTAGIMRLYVPELGNRVPDPVLSALAQTGVEVRLVQTSVAPDGSPALLATVILGAGPDAREVSISFYWRDGTWLRAS